MELCISDKLLQFVYGWVHGYGVLKRHLNGQVIIIEIYIIIKEYLIDIKLKKFYILNQYFIIKIIDKMCKDMVYIYRVVSDGCKTVEGKNVIRC